MATEELITGTAPPSNLLWAVKPEDMNGDISEGITQFFLGGMRRERVCQQDPVRVIETLFVSIVANPPFVG